MHRRASIPARGLCPGTPPAGGLNLQVEHHLFPAISFCHYPAIAEIVKDECAKRGVPYARYDTLPEVSTAEGEVEQAAWAWAGASALVCSAVPCAPARPSAAGQFWANFAHPQPRLSPPLVPCAADPGPLCAVHEGGGRGGAAAQHAQHAQRRPGPALSQPGLRLWRLAAARRPANRRGRPARGALCWFRLPRRPPDDDPLVTFGSPQPVCTHPLSMLFIWHFLLLQHFLQSIRPHFVPTVCIPSSFLRLRTGYPRPMSCLRHPRPNYCAALYLLTSFRMSPFLPRLIRSAGSQ